MLSVAAASLAASVSASASATAGVDCLDDAIAVKSFLCSFRLFVTTQTETSAASRMEDERPKRQQAVFSHSLSLPLFPLSLSLRVSLCKLGLIAALLQGKKYLLSLNDFEVSFMSRQNKQTMLVALPTIKII